MITILSPKENDVISLLTPVQKNFIKLSSSTTKESAQLDPKSPYPWLGDTEESDEELTKPATVIIKWKCDVAFNAYNIHISTSPDFSVTERICSFGSVQYSAIEDIYFASIFNLMSGYTYYVKVTCGDAVSETVSFSTVHGEIRTIRADGVGNVRDIGGRINMNGKRIRQGLIYRGGMLNDLEKPEYFSSNGLGVLRDDLGIKTDVDLRWEAVGKYEYCQLGDHINYNLIPAGAYAELLGGQQDEVYTRIFEILADEASYPIYFHCVSGADRTGTVGMILDAILGMSDEDIKLNYNITALSTPRCIYTDGGAFLDGLTEKYGNVPFREQLLLLARDLGISDELMNRSRSNLLE